MQLIERESQKQALLDALGEATNGRGRTILITGEAGIGKTSLVESFRREISGRARFLWGACEAFFSARPLGPLHDIAPIAGGKLKHQLQSDIASLDVFHSLLDDIRDHRAPSVLALEDVHWADHATLDFIRFLGRRIDRLRALLLLTFRDDELGRDHPLSAVLGELPASHSIRLKLSPLSLESVRAMAAQTGLVTEHLYGATGGNPFFVSEVLRTGSIGLTETVRDAVLARARTLSAAARDVVNFVCVSPDRINLAMLEKAWAGREQHIEECLERAILQVSDGRIGFRHDLARVAIEGTLSTLLRRRLNQTMLDLLAAQLETQPDVTRLAHHAIEARNAAAITEYAPLAAGVAIRRASYREAARLLDIVLSNGIEVPARGRAALLEERAEVSTLLQHGNEAQEFSDAAFSIWRSLADQSAMGANRARHLELLVLSRNTAHEANLQIARDAIALLAMTNSSEGLALAHAAYALAAAASGLRLEEETEHHLDEALRIESTLAAARSRARVLRLATTAQYFLYGAPRSAEATRFAEEAQRTADDALILTAHTRFVRVHIRARELEAMEAHIERGLAFAEARELSQSFMALELSLRQVDALVARGRWDVARRRYGELAKTPSMHWWMRLIFCQLQVELLNARQGRPVDWGSVREFIEDERNLTTLEHYAAARTLAEVYWLAGDIESSITWARQQLAIAHRWRHPWALGESEYWCGLVEGRKQGDKSSDHLPAPYRLQALGRWQEARKLWEERGYVYEAALTGTTGDEQGMRHCIRSMEILGAHGTADRVRDLMRSHGFSAVPRGPMRATRDNQKGLTPREHQVLLWMEQGLSNPEIARRARRSVRTIEHQVAAVITKLEARDRHEAVCAARQLGLIAVAR